jgi:bifunctional non-homologous end joining protein LigD
VSEQRVRVDGREFTVSNLDKVLFPGDGITKAELIEHYVRHGEAMLESIGGRALSLKRYPDGIEGESFFQKRPSGHFPDWITRRRVGRDGEEGDEYVVADQRATLAYLANQGTIELHTMLVPARTPDRPDELIFDLDPSKDAPTAVVRRATRRCRALLDELEVPCRLKSSGSSGFHVHVALDGTVDQETARAFARDAATVLARRHPDELTVHVRKQRRSGRVFVDWLRNSPAQTAIAPYSVRALPGAPVATPMDFDELSGTDPRRWTLRTLPRRLSQRRDPWAEPPTVADLVRARASLDAAIEELRRGPSTPRASDG